MTTTDLSDMSREIVATRNGYRDVTPAPADQIAPAVALLDAHRPGWWRKIDTSRLAEIRGWDVLGQVYGPSHRPGYGELGIADDDDASELGFSVRREDRQHPAWVAHWAAWVAEIESRRAGEPA